MPFSASSIKSSFPIFAHRPGLIYLDNAATTQKPQTVIQTMTDFYEKENANIHRGLYELSSKATQRYEGVRKKVSDLLGADAPQTIAFTKGTTESINIVAQCFLKKKLKKGDNVVITAMEHHANLIPWQQVCHQQEATLSIIPVNQDGELQLETLKTLLTSQTKLLAVTHISNVLGTINPIDEMISIAHSKKIPVLVDGAQSVGHHPVDVVKSDIDFLAFSAHKMFGPLGTGVLYCKKEFTNQLEPFNYGGGSIRSVAFDHTEFLDYPFCLEAGTANIPGVIGLGTAIDFIQRLNFREVVAYEKTLSSVFKEKLKSFGGISLVGNPKHGSGIVSFQVDSIHPHDVAGFLANENIAVRAGHHCAQPLLESMNIPATVRASFTIYNTLEDIDRTIEALQNLKKVLVMTNDMNKLYPEILKEHNRSPYHFEKRETGMTIKAFNPICGDRFEVYANLEKENQLGELYFHGIGCSVSKASTSVLAKLLEGKTVDEAQWLCTQFLSYLKRESTADAIALPEEFLAFASVHEFPERLECAALAWREMKKFLESKKK